ncbi:M23 family metallopeptidase [Colwellia sp. 1_MG-2023]|uniref:M23 family metallopeptidase n=1 Tax=Colwellia sp. 1_MG-2023 TaxID=3062649 RepID=UPI0026E2520E|nr:M23 family metallopeptidase [Colwellia sp. 1_MG-2023]
MHKHNIFTKLCLIGCFILNSAMVKAVELSFELSGKIEQGGFVLGKINAGNVVKLDDKKLTVSASGDFVFGFSRDDDKTHTLTITDTKGKTFTKTLTPKTRQYKIQRVEGIAKKIMKPNPKAVARAKKDSSQVKAARAKFSDNNAFSQGFIAPIQGIITGVYGSQRYYNGVPKSPHYGLDYAGKTGDPVKAPAKGTVVLYVADMFYSGGTMIIDHGHGITSSFLHLSDAYVNVGDTVNQGDVVAAVGSSGRATGPHLDWRINWYQMRLDPMLVLKTKPIK